MKLGLKVLSAAALAFALSACGGGNGAKLTNKDDMARAAFGAYNSSSSAQPALLKAMIDRISGSVGASASCRNGHGKVNVSENFDTSDTSGNITIDIGFDGCEAGDYKDAKGTLVPVTLDGDVTYTINASALGTGASVAIVLNGSIDFSGGIDDTLELQKLTLSESAGATGYSLSLSGTIKSNEASFTYDSSYTVTATDGTFTATAPTTGNT